MEYGGLENSVTPFLIRIILWLGFVAVTEQTECIFYEGATIVAQCEGGCCEQKCCEETPQDSTGMLAGIGVGVFLLLIVIIVGVVCFTRARWKHAYCHRKRVSVNKQEEENSLEQPGTSTESST